MNKRIIGLLKTNNNPSLHLLVYKLVEDKQDLLIQKAINRVLKETRIEEDGIVGYATISTLIKLDEDMFANKLLELMFNKTPTKLSSKQTIMSYLGRYEGTSLHWNRGEHDITTPFGVYGKSFPNSKPIRYMQTLAVKYTGRKIKSRDLRQIGKVNKSMSRAERDRIKDLCWEFYRTVFMDKRIIPILDGKSNLSWFSCCVNGGKVRGAKVLQKAVNVNDDGVIGPYTISKVKEDMKSKGTINDPILDAMLNFYKYLIRVRPKTFAIFKNGWFNRIKALR